MYDISYIHLHSSSSTGILRTHNVASSLQFVFCLFVCFLLSACSLGIENLQDLEFLYHFKKHLLGPNQKSWKDMDNCQKCFIRMFDGPTSTTSVVTEYQMNNFTGT